MSASVLYNGQLFDSWYQGDSYSMISSFFQPISEFQNVVREGELRVELPNISWDSADCSVIEDYQSNELSSQRIGLENHGDSFFGRFSLTKTTKAQPLYIRCVFLLRDALHAGEIKMSVSFAGSKTGVFDLVLPEPQTNQKPYASGLSLHSWENQEGSSHPGFEVKFRAEKLLTKDKPLALGGQVSFQLGDIPESTCSISVDESKSPLTFYTMEHPHDTSFVKAELSKHSFLQTLLFVQPDDIPANAQVTIRCENVAPESDLPGLSSLLALLQGSNASDPTYNILTTTAFQHHSSASQLSFIMVTFCVISSMIFTLL